MGLWFKTEKGFLKLSSKKEKKRKTPPPPPLFISLVSFSCPKFFGFGYEHKIKFEIKMTSNPYERRGKDNKLHEIIYRILSCS